MGMWDVLSYCITTNFTSFIAFSIAIFMARFAKPKEWTWVWLGIGAFASGAILYNDYCSATKILRNWDKINERK